MIRVNKPRFCVTGIHNSNKETTNRIKASKDNLRFTVSVAKDLKMSCMSGLKPATRLSRSW